MKVMALLLAVFLVVTGVAELAGAANLGTAAAFGQMGFAVALIAALLQGR